jgi:hypothetical protein
MPERKVAPPDAKIVERDDNGVITSHPKPEKETPEQRIQRKAAVGLTKLPDPKPELVAKSVNELNNMSDALDKQIAELREKKKEVHAARVRRLAVEHAAYYGLTPEEYAAVKEEAKKSNEPNAFTKLLSKARGEAASRAVQIATALPASVGAEVKPTRRR